MNIWFLRRVLLTFEQCFSKKARLTVSLGKKKSSKQFRSKIVVLEFLINCQSLNTLRNHNLKEKFWLWLFIFLIQFIQNFQLRQCRQKKTFQHLICLKIVTISLKAFTIDVLFPFSNFSRKKKVCCKTHHCQTIKSGRNCLNFNFVLLTSTVATWCWIIIIVAIIPSTTMV